MKVQSLNRKIFDSIEDAEDCINDFNESYEEYIDNLLSDNPIINGLEETMDSLTEALYEGVEFAVPGNIEIDIDSAEGNILECLLENVLRSINDKDNLSDALSELDKSQEKDVIDKQQNLIKSNLSNILYDESIKYICSDILKHYICAQNQAIVETTYREAKIVISKLITYKNGHYSFNKFGDNNWNDRGFYQLTYSTNTMTEEFVEVINKPFYLKVRIDRYLKNQIDTVINEFNGYISDKIKDSVKFYEINKKEWDFEIDVKLESVILPVILLMIHLIVKDSIMMNDYVKSGVNAVICRVASLLLGMSDKIDNKEVMLNTTILEMEQFLLDIYVAKLISVKDLFTSCIVYLSCSEITIF